LLSIFIEEHTSSKNLPVGTGLPALRSMAKQLKVKPVFTRLKPTTIFNKWVDIAQPQSGYFVANQITNTAFPTLNAHGLNTKGLDKETQNVFAPSMWI